MVEGMVMELYKDYVVVMTKSGEFLKLRKRGIVNIGDIYKEKVYRRIPVFTYTAAAALIFVVTSFAGYTAYANQIVGYVDIKGNKDVRLYVSRNGTVEKVDGVENANVIKDLPVDQAVEELNEIAPIEGIYDDSSDVAVITTKVKDSKLDLTKVDENVKKILSQDKKSNENNTNKPVMENEDNNSNKGSKDSNNEINKDTTKQDNKSQEQIKNNNNNDNNKGKIQDNKDKETEDNKTNNKNKDNKSKNKNEKNSFYKFIKSKYDDYFKNK